MFLRGFLVVTLVVLLAGCPSGGGGGSSKNPYAIDPVDEIATDGTTDAGEGAPHVFQSQAAVVAVEADEPAPEG